MNPFAPGPLSAPDPQQPTSISELTGATILSAVAFKSGSLRLVFDNGLHLTCCADTTSCQVTGPSGWRFVAGPGRRPTVYSPRTCAES
ncbi:DUF6188 family protein [Streptomyces sp. DI166]|uniref:DUF6188 family protein n=1 Tax=Streptomyces sp. DI166 TaxID=1839783 RepID=UPI00350E3B02